jgi:flavin-dependent dehydrogenase
MPPSRDGEHGRALGREHFDTLLLRAVAGCATVLQPWSITAIEQKNGGFICHAIQKESRKTKSLRAPIVIAAHGSWEPGSLPTQLPRCTSRASDLFGFKAHFRDTNLPTALMPLLVFPGGYGGMVHTDGGRVSLSCCIRRDQLERRRHLQPNTSAAEAVLTHIKNSCRGVREALRGASVDGAWLSAGPIHPGIRVSAMDEIFRVGNAAGEAHPIIAEGITMAMQSSWLLCELLMSHGATNLSRQTMQGIAREYGARWRKGFAPRVRAAALFSQLAMHPAATAMLVPAFRFFPSLLTAGARFSGKANDLAVG